MKNSFYLLVVILVGLFGLVVIFMFENITLNNDSEYYSLKEAMEAAMIESVDISCYKMSKNVDPDACDGELKISEQKFVENFTRRFASSVNGNVDNYILQFYDIMEMPPKASVVVISKDKRFKAISESVIINNELTSILEAGWGEYIVDDSGLIKDTSTNKVDNPLDGFSSPKEENSSGSIVGDIPVVPDDGEAESDAANSSSGGNITLESTGEVNSDDNNSNNEEE